MKSLILLLIAMSAAGTFPFIIYIALSTIFDNYISARFRYRCLKYCLLLYLVPFPLLKYFIYHRYFSTPKPLNGNVVIFFNRKNRSDIYWILFKFRGIFTENIYRIMDLFLKYNNFL